MDYRRRWQQTRLRRTRQRLGIALGALALVALVVLVGHYAHRGGAAWIYTPPRAGLVHFSVEGPDLCAVWDTGRLVALEIASGTERPNSEFRRAFPFLSPPLLTKGRVLVGAEDGRMRCLDLVAGQALWEHRTGGAVRSLPVIAGDSVLFGSDDGFLYCVELGTGVRRWRTFCGGAVGTAPAVIGDRAVVGTVGYGIGCVDLAERAGGASPEPPATTAAEASAAKPAPGPNSSALERWLWGVAVPAAVLGPPVTYADGKVAVGSDEGAVYLLDVVTGKILVRLERPGLVRNPPALVAGGLVVADSSGEVCALAADGRTLWSRRLRSNPLVGPVTTDAAVYVGTAGGEVLALRAGDGHVLWRRDLSAPAAGSLAVAGDLVLVGLEDGRICAFRKPARG